MLVAIRDNHTIFVPTLAILEKLQPADRFANICSNVKRAHDLGVHIACGGDTGTFSHGENAREMELLLMCGIPMPDVLEACGGEQCGRRFGWFEEGCQADYCGAGCGSERQGEKNRCFNAGKGEFCNEGWGGLENGWEGGGDDITKVKCIHTYLLESKWLQGPRFRKTEKTVRSSDARCL